MLFSSQDVQAKSKTSITKLMSALGAFAACVFAIAIPSMYYAISINGTQHALTIEATFLAKSIEKIIQDRPNLWEFESVRLLELISQNSRYGEKHEREIYNTAGTLVVKTDFIETRPKISASESFFDSGRLAGSIIVKYSILRQLIITALLGIFSSFLGYLIYLIFRAYPIRKLNDTLTALQRERDRAEKTLYAIGDGVISVDHKGKILLINRVAESLVGMDASKAVGRQLEEVYVLRQCQENKVGEKKVVLTSKGGNEYTIEEVRTSLTKIKSDKSGVVIVFRDITERKRAEEALRESEKRYRDLSIVDDLTQLYNSRHFYHQLKMEIDRTNRYGQPLTLMLLDLDDFKRFNDTYGHIEGDQVLLRLGQVIKRCLRQTDSAYRYGGEEFTIILPMTTVSHGAVTAGRIRAEFKKEDFSPTPGQDVHMTVSIGIAQYKPQEDIKTFIHRVDQLMYQGKKNGKDEICFEL